MIYGVKIKKTDSGIWVQGDGGVPRDSVLAFETKADYDTFQTWLWSSDCTGPDHQSGHNLIRVSRKRLEGWFGRDFATSEIELSDHIVIKDIVKDIVIREVLTASAALFADFD